MPISEEDPFRFLSAGPGLGNILGAGSLGAATQVTVPQTRPPAAPSNDPEKIDAELEAIRTRIITELDRLTTAITGLRERQDSLRAILRGLDATLGIGEEQLSGWAAVEAVALDAIEAGNDEDRDGALTVAEIVAELARRGWLPESEKPESAVRSAIRRLRDKDPRWSLYQGRLYYHDRPLDDEEEDA